MENSKFIKGADIYYPAIIKDVRKSSDQLQPIYEAFTNSMESIRLLNKDEELKNNYIIIKLFHRENIQHELFIEQIIIEDNGIGFDDSNFDRLTRYKDTRKNFNNKGSGRIQLIHYFNEVDYHSTYRDRSDNTIKERNFILSKTQRYLDQNAIILLLKNGVKIDSTELKTTLTLKTLLEDKDITYYNKLGINKLKEKLINHYIASFCTFQDNLPIIKLEQYINEILKDSLTINKDDLPKIDKTDNFSIHYSKLNNGKIEIVDKEEKFQIMSFCVDKSQLDKNEIKLTVKNEIVENTKLKLESLLPSDTVEDKRFLFLLSSDYLNNRDSDTRGNLNIPTKEEYRNNSGNMFLEEEILLEDIEKQSNNKINDIYPQIKSKEQENNQKIESLKSMFLLNDEVLKEISISINDSEEKILEKFYTAESKILAKGDSKIKEQVDELNRLDPSKPEYEQELNEKINLLVKEIPMQNRVALTQYVARRKLVLDLFDKILNKELLRQKEDNKRNNDESLIHNLIFKQHSKNPSTSDLWLLNEDFVLFSGSSESELRDLEYRGEKILRDDEDLTQEQIAHRDSLQQKRYEKRTDTLLFPNEGKCIIIEYKAPQVDIAQYLTQIQNYATIILNYSKKKFKFTTFYGYLLGEEFSPLDVRSHAPEFVQSYHFDYMYKSPTTVASLWDEVSDGSIYMEILKYKTLYERAKERNNIFINKLGLNLSDNIENNELPPF